MDSLTAILVLILGIGLTQGIVFAMIIWRKSDVNQKANRYKAVLLFVLSYGLLNQVLRLFGIGHYDAWYHLTLELNWSYGILLFLYVKALVFPDFQLSKSERWMFFPVLVQVICSIYVRSQNFFWDGTPESLSWLGYWGYNAWMNYSTVPIIASGLIIFYSIKALRLLRTVPAHDVIQENLIWVRTLVKVFAVYYAIVLCILAIDLTYFVSTISSWYFYRTRFYYYPFFIGMAILLYWFGISSIMRKDERLFRPRKKLSGAEEKGLNEIAENLDKLIREEKAYKDPELTLASLAAKLQIKPYLLTRTLNEVLHKSFTDYINEIRVTEVSRLINDPNNDKFTLLSLAFEAGFNSKSSFNRAVKKHLGIPPSQLKRQP